MKVRFTPADLEEWARLNGYTQAARWEEPYGTIYVAEKLCDPLPKPDPNDENQQIKHFHVVWYVARGAKVRGSHFRANAIVMPLRHQRLQVVKESIAEAMPVVLWNG